MVFTAPSWAPPLPEVPDSIPICEFYSNEDYGRRPLATSRAPYTCGITGLSYSAFEVRDRTAALSRALAKRLEFAPNKGTEWDKVVCLFSANSIDYITACHAVHRLSGIVTPASAAYMVDELTSQLKASDSKAIFTCVKLLPVALEAARRHNVAEEKVFLFEMHDDPKRMPEKHTTVNQLIAEGRSLPELEPLKWSKGQGKRQTAFLSCSSGTSGLPKGVMVSHYNVLANTIQFKAFDSVAQQALRKDTQLFLGVLPFSHIYALVAITHATTARGDGVVVLPSFDMDTYLAATERFKIEVHNVVPPIVVTMIQNREKCAKYDLTCIRLIITAAAPLGAEVGEMLKKLIPTAKIAQGYGMTETATIATYSNELDIVDGSSGCIMPGNRMKLMDPEGKEVTEYGSSGELWIQGPSIVLGYMHNAKADAETFVWDEEGRWIKTGDKVMAQRSPTGDDVFFIIDRIKELIKTKGHQVAPAELEAHLLTHASVNDCAVIPVPDENAGEVPKAYVVRSAAARARPEAAVAAEICKFVEDKMARYKRLKGGVAFVDTIPKTPSGKILRRLLRDREKEQREAKQKGAKL